MRKYIRHMKRQPRQRFAPNFIFVFTGLVAVLAFGALIRSSLADDPAPAEHVVVIVWDGLRPDSVTEQDTPTLFKLAKEGTTFAHNHCVYVSSTEVNGAALATGGYPRTTGIVANAEYRPDIDPLKSFGTESEMAVRRGDELTHSRYIGLPTVAEIVQRSGRRTVIAGSKPVALLLDRSIGSDATDPSELLYQ